jgi:hypothetical protein
MRTRYWEFMTHMVKNGVWVLLPCSFAPGISFSLRHIVPLVFMVSMIALTVLSFHFPVVSWFMAGLVAVYAAANLYFSARIAAREKAPAYFFVLPGIFFSLHAAYGLGSIAGGVLMIFLKVKHFFDQRQQQDV